MAPPRVYADATTLIGLARLDRLDLLTLFPTPILVTTVVWREVAYDQSKPGVAALYRARAEQLLEVVAEGDPEAFPDLDRGESTVLSAAAVARAAVLIDERKARILIQTDDRLKSSIPQFTGIIGLLLLAKRRGRIATVRPDLDQLIQQNFWISPSFYQQILQHAGEE
ncbi:MAG TPA: DUF3368 domain-containing protein [Thermomicrobiaceae bacterium]|nr:DUF3368 domain-containing protein [Thermomicrobiaceae bacterium]